MRALRLALAGCCVSALLTVTACGGSGGPPHPAGWTAQRRAGSTVWTNPRDRQEHFSSSSAPAGGSSLGSLASQITTNTVLRYQHAKLLSAKPFPHCPGEAGWQTFSVSTPAGPAVLHVGFTVWEGKRKMAAYERPSSAPDDPAALQAMRETLCTG